MRKIIIIVGLMVTVSYVMGSQQKEEVAHNLSDFANGLKNDPFTVYLDMIEQSSEIKDLISAIGIPKEQELAFLFQLLPEISKKQLQTKFQATFGKNPEDIIDTAHSYQIFGFLVARTPKPTKETLTTLAQLWQALPAKTADEKYARDFMRNSFHERFNIYPEAAF